MADSLVSSPPVPLSTEASSLASGVSADAVPSKRFLGRTVSVHELLGGGSVADLLMWKDWKRSTGFLATVTLLWSLFTVARFTVVTILADACLLLMTCVFVWAQFCRFTKKDGPTLPDLKLEPDALIGVVEALCNEVNKVLAMAQGIALGGSLVQFLQVCAALYAVSLLGSWVDGLTLCFITVLLSFTAPYFYDKYEDHVDQHLNKASEHALKLYEVAQVKAMATAKQLHGKVQESLGKLKKSPVEKKVQ